MGGGANGYNLVGAPGSKEEYNVGSDLKTVRRGGRYEKQRDAHLLARGDGSCV